MKYYKDKDGEFIQNGPCKIKVGTLDHLPSPTTPGRILKMVVVLDVIKQSITNPILPDQALALSFPESQVNNKQYVWNVDGPEEIFVPLKLKVT